MKNKLDLIYEDDAIIVVNKAPNFLTLPDRYAPNLPNLLHHLTLRYGKVFTVHRLDKETSGLLVFARTEDSHKYLSQQFSHRTVDKLYYALLEGQLHQSEGSIDKAIAPHPNGKGKMIVSAKGKASLRKLQTQDLPWVRKGFLETSRSHQCR